MKTFWLVSCALVASSTWASAQQFEVRVQGTLEFNLITTGPLASVPVGSPVEMTARVDAAVFTNSPNFPTRGYPLVAGSFALDLGPGVVGLQQPFPAGQTPYFVLRNNDPAVDGFFLSNSFDFPIGVPLNVNGGLGPLRADFSVTYGGATLPSLDIADAVGSYDFTGLSVFNWTLDDGPFQPVGILFATLEIAELTPCGYSTYGVGISPTNNLVLQGVGSPAVGGVFRAAVANPPTTSFNFLALALGQSNLPLLDGVLLVDPTLALAQVQMSAGSGAATVLLPIPADAALAGLSVHAQAFGIDPNGPEGWALSNGLTAVFCP